VVWELGLTFTGQSRRPASIMHLWLFIYLVRDINQGSD